MIVFAQRQLNKLYKMTIQCQSKLLEVETLQKFEE